MSSRRPRPDQPRIALPVILLAVAMAVGGIVYGIKQATSDSAGNGKGPKLMKLGRSGSSPVADGPPLQISAPPESYTISYRVEIDNGTSYRQQVAVRRPFGRRKVERRKDGREVEETTFGRLASRRPDGTVNVLAISPSAPDPRPDAVVADAIRYRLLERREQRRVLGRRCQVYRSKSSVTAGRISKATKSEWADVCVDDRGLLVEELEAVNGHVYRRRIATSVDTSTGVPDSLLHELPASATVDASKGGGSVRRVDPSSLPQGRFFAVDAAPALFIFEGRYSVVPPQAALADPDRHNEAVASTDDLFLSGGDFIDVSNGGTLGRSKAFEPLPDSPKVDLGPILGEGEVVMTWSGPEVRVPLPEGRFVRVHGTVPVDTLVSVARSLRETAGGSGLVYVDQAG